MKKLLAALLALLLLTGCQKKKTQAEITLPEPEPPAAEETTAEPAEEPEETMPEDSGAEPEEENAAPDLGNFKELLEVLPDAANTRGLEKQPGIRDDYGTKGEGTQLADQQFYHGQDSLDLRDTAWGDRDLPGMPDGGKTNEKRRKKDIGAGFGESYDTDACSVQ